VSTTLVVTESSFLLISMTHVRAIKSLSIFIKSTFDHFHCHFLKNQFEGNFQALEVAKIPQMKYFITIDKTKRS
jgi:hypothetical protein